MLIKLKAVLLIEIKAVLSVVKSNNPYPSDIFIEPTKEEWIKVQKIFKEAGLVQDKFFGSAGRSVWNNCIANVEKELEEY